MRRGRPCAPLSGDIVEVARRRLDLAGWSRARRSPSVLATTCISMSRPIFERDRPYLTGNSCVEDGFRRSRGNYVERKVLNTTISGLLIHLSVFYCALSFFPDMWLLHTMLLVPCRAGYFEWVRVSPHSSEEDTDPST